MLPNDAVTVVERFTIMRTAMRAMGLLCGNTNPFMQASEEERGLGIQSVEEYIVSVSAIILSRS
jgi:hypothetical protein